MATGRSAHKTRKPFKSVLAFYCSRKSRREPKRRAPGSRPDWSSRAGRTQLRVLLPLQCLIGAGELQVSSSSQRQKQTGQASLGTSTSASTNLAACKAQTRLAIARIGRQLGVGAKLACQLSLSLASSSYFVFRPSNLSPVQPPTWPPRSRLGLCGAIRRVERRLAPQVVAAP